MTFRAPLRDLTLALKTAGHPALVAQGFPELDEDTVAAVLEAAGAFTEEELAFGAHEEVGAGGHFLGAEHTMERFRTCFYRPFLWNSDNFERWMRLGGRDTVERAREIYEQKLEDYEQPPLDDAIRASVTAQGFQPSRTVVEISGICAACAAKASAV